MAKPSGTVPTDGSRLSLLGIYLNDHLAGATGGVELFRRAAGAHRGAAIGQTLEQLSAEIAQDREALLDMMHTLGVPIRHYKVYVAWAAEKVGRLKLNGHVLDRSPLSDLVEFEAMRLGVQGKAAGWQTLRALAERDSRLDAGRLDGLVERARRQIETLEDLRLRAAENAFRAG